jgi:GTPase Era involved in 16S rRNA processing/outer membrane lipoprotein SlyB
MKNYQQQRKQIIQLFQQVQTLVTQSNRKDIAKTLQESAARYAEGKLFVVVAGEFKQGKSSFINAIINEKKLFPVDIDITTNLVSTITYGKEEKVTVVVGEPGKGKPKNITRAEIPDYVTEQKNSKNQKKAQMLIIESPNPQLKEGLVLVDTPGVGGLNTEHTAVSYAFIPNADVVIFVSDTQKPLTVKELEFVEMINRHCQNFLFVITKKDIGNYQKIVDSNREKLIKILNCAGEAINLIPVSSKTKLAYLETKDDEDLEDSNFVALETELWQILEKQRGSILSLRALADLGQALTQIKTPIEAEWEACQQSPDELAAIQEEFQEVQQRLQTLLKNNGSWQNKLNDGLQDIRENILNSYRQEINQIYNQAEQELDDSQILSNPEQLISKLEVEIDSLVVKLTDQIGELASSLQQEIKKETQLDVNPFPNSSLTATENQSYSFNQEKIKRSNLWEKTLNVTQNAGYKSMIGGSVGSIVGGFLGGAFGALFGGVGAAPGAAIGSQLGAFLGGIGGIATGTKQALSIEKEKTKRQVLVEIKKFIDQIQQQYFNSLNSTIKELQRTMRDELTTQIQQEKETCDRTLRSLKEAQKLTQEQTARKIAELKPLLQRINHLEQQITKLAEIVLAQKEAASFTTTDEPPHEEQPETKPVTTVGVTTSNVEDDEDWADG